MDWMKVMRFEGPTMSTAQENTSGVKVAPASAEVLHQLFLDAGVPSGLFVRLPATREAGAKLAEADVDHVVFTGSVATGAKLAARLGERLVPSTLELSGCDAMFILADADVPLAARAAWFAATKKGS